MASALLRLLDLVTSRPMRSAAYIAHLHRWRCSYARHLSSVLFHVRKIADDKDLRMVRRVQVLIDLHATAAIEAVGHAEGIREHPAQR